MSFETLYKYKDISLVHLDDHSLFGKALMLGVRDKYLPVCNWNHFFHPDNALEYIENLFIDKRDVHYIITDFNHPGMNGCEFAIKVKELQAKYLAPPVQIDLYSMQPINSEPIIKYNPQELFGKCFCKSEDFEILGEHIKVCAQFREATSICYRLKHKSQYTGPVDENFIEF